MLVIESERIPSTSVPEASSECPENCFYRRMVFWLLVVAQFIIAGLMVMLLESARNQVGTAILAAGGIAIGIWALVTMDRKTLNASPAVRPGAQLIVRGPYRFVRHPMYTALLMFCGAIAISDFSWFGLQLWIALGIVLSIKIAYEESMLTRRYPDYSDYAARVKRIIPFVF